MKRDIYFHRQIKKIKSTQGILMERNWICLRWQSKVLKVFFFIRKIARGMMMWIVLKRIKIENWKCWENKLNIIEVGFWIPLSGNLNCLYYLTVLHSFTTNRVKKLIVLSVSQLWSSFGLENKINKFVQQYSTKST